MRKSLIISAAIAASTLFAGIASADEGRGVERPTVQNLRAGRNVDAAERTAAKIREKSEHTTRSTSSSKQVERKLEKNRPRADMVDAKGTSTRHADRTARTIAKNSKGERLVSSRTRPKGDVVENNNGNVRAFTIANDRKSRTDSSGPRSIVDVMKRREVLSFISGLGVKVNCSQTGTCTEETAM